VGFAWPDLLCVAALAAAKGASHWLARPWLTISPPQSVAVLRLSLEAITIGFSLFYSPIPARKFVLILEGSTLISLTSVSAAANTIVAILFGHVLFIYRELLHLPEVIASAKGEGLQP